MKNKYWLIAFALLCLVCAGAWMALPSKSGSHVVEIYQNSKLLYAIDLDTVQEPYNIVLGDDEMYNTLHITHDDICITHATCPDKVCVHRGKLSEKASPIVCLPNRVLIQYQDSQGDGVDAVTGAVS